MDRYPQEFVQCAVVFLGFVLGTIGVVTLSVPLWLLGGAMTLEGFLYFYCKQEELKKRGEF